MLKYDLSVHDSIYLQHDFRYEAHIEIRVYVLVALTGIGYLVPGHTHAKA